MRSLKIIHLTILIVLFPSFVAAQVPKTIGEIERLDPRLDNLIPANGTIDVLAGGFTWTEGPVWIDSEDGGHLLFSDIPRNTIFKWSEASGIETFMRPSGYTGVSYYGLEPGSNGLALDSQGRLNACEHGDRRVSMLSKGGGKITVVDSYEGKRLNSPNDLVFGSNGDIYFTDPPYGLPQRADDPMRELDFCGVYRFSTDGELALLTKELARPNGIGLSPDESSLIVAQSDPSNPIWMKYPILDDKTLGDGVELFNAKAMMGQFPGLPDGLAIHPSGVVFGSGPGGIYILTTDGELLGRILTRQRTSNCTFSSDLKTLYITSDNLLCRLKLVD